MASTFKMEPYTHRVDTSWMGGRGTTATKLKRAGYLSATPVYEKIYVRRSRGGNKGRTLPITTPNVDPKRYYVKNKIIAYDASIMTRVEYRQAPPPPAPAAATAPATSIASATTFAAPATTSIKQEPVKQPGIGANRGRTGSRGRGNTGVASSAFAGNIGSVNTEIQNDDVLMPYMKNNI